MNERKEQQNGRTSMAFLNDLSSFSMPFLCLSFLHSFEFTY